VKKIKIKGDDFLFFLFLFFFIFEKKKVLPFSGCLSTKNQKKNCLVQKILWLNTKLK